MPKSLIGTKEVNTLKDILHIEDLADLSGSSKQFKRDAVTRWHTLSKSQGLAAMHHELTRLVMVADAGAITLVNERGMLYESTLAGKSHARHAELTDTLNANEQTKNTAEKELRIRFRALATKCFSDWSSESETSLVPQRWKELLNDNLTPTLVTTDESKGKAVPSIIEKLSESEALLTKYIESLLYGQLTSADSDARNQDFGAKVSYILDHSRKVCLELMSDPSISDEVKQKWMTRILRWGFKLSLLEGQL